MQSRHATRTPTKREWENYLALSWAQHVEKERRLFEQLLEMITMLVGKKGRGKSLSAVGISYKLRELFDIPVIVIGSKLGLNNYYGPYKLINEYQFIEQLESIRELSENTPQDIVQEEIDKAVKAMGIDLYRSVQVFDEAYKLFESRTPGDKFVRAFGYYVAQSRHYHSTILLCTPHQDMIDKRVRQQIDWRGRCFWSKRRHTCVVGFKQGMDTWALEVFGPNYWHMYNTHSLVGFRKRHLEVGEI